MPGGRPLAPFLLAAGVLLVAVAMALPAMEGGRALPPQLGASGVGGSCRECHTGPSGVDIGASLGLHGVPETFEPRRAYTITVALDRGTGPRPHHDILHGFQLGVTDGVLEVADAGTMQVSDTEVGSRGATDATVWTVVWHAPETHGDVAFLAEAIVADGDGTETGDASLEATAFSYGPLDVPLEEEPGPWPYRHAVVVISVAALVGAGYAIAFWNRRPPPPPDEED